MRKQMRIVLATVMMLAVIDLGVAGVLQHAPQSLVRFFDYGRSVPGKLARWRADDDLPDSLLNAAWRDEMLADSARDFRRENDAVPVVRNYGMSFTSDILDAAMRRSGRMDHYDNHSGPAAPPNFTFASFLDDRPDRRAGDVVVLGILSSSVHALSSFSNRTWVFEQPAPFTYPIFLPDPVGKGLLRLDPDFDGREAEERATPQQLAAWHEKLARQDRLYTDAAFAWPGLDASPFLRLIRRALATHAIAGRKQELLAHPDDGALPYAEVLRRMAREFAAVARQDRQFPIVILVQGRDAGDPDLSGILGETLRAEGIAYLATADWQNPRDPRAFIGDGHYTQEANDLFAQVFLRLVPDHRLAGIR